MPPLRASQVETLRLVGIGGTWGVSLDRVATSLGITEHSAERRLYRLRCNPTRPLIETVFASYFPGTPRFRFYRLTQLGREALEGRWRATPARSSPDCSRGRHRCPSARVPLFARAVDLACSRSGTERRTGRRAPCVLPVRPRSGRPRRRLRRSGKCRSSSVTTSWNASR